MISEKYANPHLEIGRASQGNPMREYEMNASRANGMYRSLKEAIDNGDLCRIAEIGLHALTVEVTPNPNPITPFEYRYEDDVNERTAALLDRIADAALAHL